MSDLAATNCGCGCDDRCGCGQEESCGCGGGMMNCFGNGSSCSCILWIIILLSFCGNGGFGCNNGGCGCGCADNSCLLIIILLLCCGGGFGC